MRMLHVLRWAKVGAVLVGAMSAMGCDDKKSSELATGDIEASYSVDIDTRDPAKPVTKLSATLKTSEKASTGPQTTVELTDGDSLVVTTDKNDTINLKKDGSTYDGSIDNANALVYTFRLKRNTGAAEGTVITMPGPLALTDNPNGKSFAAGDTVKFAWSNKSPTGKLFVSGSSYPCGGSAVNLAADQRLPFDDTGTMEVPVAKLYDVGTPKAGDCVRIVIERQIRGEVDKGLDAKSSAFGSSYDRLEIKVN